MIKMHSATDWWRNNTELAHIVPPGTGAGPEAFDICEMLRLRVQESVRVLDFGCGVGRLAGCFDPDLYTGVDVNFGALLRAEVTHPEYRFELVQDELPRVDCVLAYTVLLHVPDEDIGTTVARLVAAAPRAVVVEILGRKWRGRPGALPGTFNRDIEDYIGIFEAHGMALHLAQGYPYARYGGVSITAMEFRKC